jgi:CO/xanthine dehydrogenase FAD-binding subunit
MPVTVKTFATSGEAAAALSSERDARYLGGGTLVMRALNEGDLSVSTVVRATDRALRHVDIASSRITIGAGVTFARVLAERELGFLHPVAGSIGGPAVRNMGTIGGNLFAPTPFGDFAVALLALDATVSVQGGYGARDVPVEEFLAGRDRLPGALVLSISCQRPSGTDAFRYRKIARIKPKGGSVVTLAAYLPTSGGRIVGARIGLGAMAATPKDGCSTRRASPPRSPPRRRGLRRSTIRSPAPGIGARLSASICAACLPARIEESARKKRWPRLPCNFVITAAMSPSSSMAASIC